MIKISQHMRNKGDIFNLISAIHGKHSADIIILHGERLNVIPLISVTRQRCPLSYLYSSLYLET